MRAWHISQYEIPGGDAGVLATLRHMAVLVDEGVDDPAVVTLARRLVGLSAERWSSRFAARATQDAHAIAIRTWLGRVWQFVDDPFDRDLLMAPGALLAQYSATGVIAGDCDEAAILGAALGRAVGLRAQFVVFGFPSDVPGEPDRYAHVFARLLTDAGAAYSLDITRPPGPVPMPTRILTMDA